MFFYIGTDCPFVSMIEVESGLFLDQGWESINGIYYKGYSTDCVLAENLYDVIQGKIKPKGKYCIIKDKKIYHPEFRGFPIYKIKGGITNVKFSNSEYLSYDLIPITDTTPIGLETASTLIGDILYENIKNSIKYNDIKRMNMLYSMGLDSLTCWAILDSITKDYDLHIHLPSNTSDYQKRMGVRRQYTNDLIKHMSTNSWGHEITSIFVDKNYYLTGFYSERIQLREVTTGHAIAKFYKKKLYMMTRPSDYLYYFLQRPSNKINSCDQDFSNEKECKDYCYNTVFYDHQMWHIDNNYHISPFFDIRIAQICYRLTLEDICKNAMNGLIQKNIIARFRPDFLKLLSDYKNSGDIWKNFKSNWNKIKLSSDIVINIT